MTESTERGILIIAQGRKRYIDMARQIAVSLRISNPHLPIALVTDSTDPSLKKYYDHIIPVDPSLGIGFVQKVNMYSYSPFEKTMFIDADCLVIRNIDFLFRLFEGKAVSVIGKKIYTGALLGTTIEALQKKLAITYLPTFNGGVYYFEKGEQARKTFELAFDLFRNRYEELGLWKFSGKPGDEPVMSIAMALNNMEPIDDNGNGMYTPVGQEGVFKMDSLKGVCEFYKYGKKVTPAIMHFGGGYPDAFHYRREASKMNLVYYMKLPAWFSSAAVNMLYNPAYIVYVFMYRLASAVLKKRKFKMSPLMPMFRFE